MDMNDNISWTFNSFYNFAYMVADLIKFTDWQTWSIADCHGDVSVILFFSRKSPFTTSIQKSTLDIVFSPQLHEKQQ